MSRKMWSFEYEPSTIDSMVLNEDIRPTLKKAIKDVPNILLYGTPGVGKGTFTNILLKETGYDNLWINASDHTGIDVIREKIRPFATAYAMSEMKLVILNEADSLTSGPQGAQKMLRQLMEDTHKICRFIFLCNYENYIIPEIKSRCSVIKIDNPPKGEIGKLALSILKKERIKFEKKTFMEIISKCYPDIRKTIMVFQENSIDGQLTGSRVYASEVLFEQILKDILAGDLEKVRTELKSNFIQYEDLYSYLYENAGEFKQPGAVILGVGEHLYRDQQVAIKEINFMHMIVEFIYDKVI